MQIDHFDIRQNKILAAKSYLDFKTVLLRSNCSKCALCESRTHIVPDRGNSEARVMIIGEAPGENEDRQGKAFVGRAGRLLDQMMKDAGFDTDQDSLIVNVVKCRPPDNRAPKPEEVKACFPFLARQIELVKPSYILLLGATAMKHVFPEKKSFSMASQVGNFFTDPKYPGVECMALFHPAYLLRDPRKKPLMAEHIERFKRAWRATPPRTFSI